MGSKNFRAEARTASRMGLAVFPRSSVVLHCLNLGGEQQCQNRQLGVRVGEQQLLFPLASVSGKSSAGDSARVGKGLVGTL